MPKEMSIPAGRWSGGQAWRWTDWLWNLARMVAETVIYLEREEAGGADYHSYRGLQVGESPAGQFL
jgi:hypothetical protein